MQGFYGNINVLTETNTYYRQVLSTTPNMQLVVMSLLPRQEIGMEIHPYVTQFIRVERGTGIAIVDNNQYTLSEGDAIVIPLSTYHNIINTSYTEPMKLYTIYSPPNHPIDHIDVVKPAVD